MANIEIVLTSNKDEILKAAAEQIFNGLEAIGVEAEGYAKDECPVESGRLRASITYATAMAHSSPGKEAEPEDANVQAKPENNAVYIGTNVEYAPYVEYNDNASHKTGKAHFLRDAATNHSDRYRAIMEAALKT